jgi:peroxiredoxin
MKIYVILFALALAGCSTTSEVTEKGYPQEPNWKEEAQTWQSNVKAQKTLLKNGQKEVLTLDSIDWLKELEIVTQTDWNSVSTKDKYTLDSVKLQFVNETRYIIRAKDSSRTVQFAEFTYRNKRLAQAYYRVREENAVYGLSREIHILPGELISVSAAQKVTALMNEAFEVKLEVLPPKVHYLGHLQREDGIKLPVRFYVQNDDFVIYNGAEKVEAKMVQYKDSLLVEMPVFPTSFHLVKTATGFEGYWQNRDGTGYTLPFSAKQIEAKPMGLSSYIPQLSGDWRVQFQRPDKTIDALGLFEQSATQLFGTFVTRSGDYRSLEGGWEGDSLYLSAFEGSHAYLFTGKLKGDSIYGHWYSGKSFHIPWKAHRDSTFKLPSADTLTYLKEGYTEVNFSFPGLDGNNVSLSDSRFEDKPVIITIMGSWCPNCMDEARYLKDVYARYKETGLQIVGLSFERYGDYERDLPALQKMVTDLEIPYPVLHAGKAGGKYAAEALPMLNHIIAFPTAIYINREGEVVKIHTGFTGPATGERYTRFVEENEAFLQGFVR